MGSGDRNLCEGDEEAGLCVKNCYDMFAEKGKGE